MNNNSLAQFNEARKQALSELERGGFINPTEEQIAAQTLFANQPTAKEQWEQLGIVGVAPNKPVETLENKPIIRKRLNWYITHFFGTTKQGFARMVDASPATVTKWLHTKAMPSTGFIQRIAYKTGLDFEEVLDLFNEGMA